MSFCCLMCLMAGIRDIAEKCGVSAGAVSRILNGDPSFSVTQQVREAVEKEAERLGYKTPRQRRNDNPHIILMLAPIDKPGFESELFSMLQPMARQAGFELSLADCHGRADGLIALGEFTPEEIGCFQSMAEHLLFINNLGLDFSYDSIKVDYRYAEEQVIDFFLSKGIRRIGYAGGTFRRSGVTIGRRRFEAFTSMLSEKGLLNEDWVFSGNMDASSGYDGIMAMKEVPDGILISDPETAEGVHRALRERKSDAIAITYNNFFPVSGTELRIFTPDVWHTAFRLISEKIKGEREQNQCVFCPARLLENT